MLLPETDIFGSKASPARLPVVLMGSVKVAPPFGLSEKKISPTKAISSNSFQIAYTLSVPEATSCGADDCVVLLLRFSGVLKVVPPSRLAAKNISLFPGSLSCHTTYTLVPDRAICGSNESPLLVLLTLMLPPKLKASAFTFERREETGIRVKAIVRMVEMAITLGKLGCRLFSLLWPKDICLETSPIRMCNRFF